MDHYILALDSGTTSNRAILFDHKGNIKGISQKEFEQIFPKPGWVEHNPEEIWSTQKFVVRDVLKKKGIDAAHINAIGITNQRETTLVWDRSTGEPVYNAIVWQDRRTAAICDQLRKDHLDGKIQQKTGLVVDAYFSGSKVKWILDNVPGTREKAQKGQLAFGTVDTWLMWRLTHGKLHITDVSNASRTMLFNIHTLDWDDELLEILNIPRNMLPEVRSCSEVYGQTEKEHFGGEIPIAGIAGDQQAALFGQMCVSQGMIKNTYGTGCFVMMNTGEEAVMSKNNLLTTIAWKLDGKINYALEGSIFIAGAAVQWLRDQVHIINSASEIEKLARTVEDNGGVFFVPAFVGLGAPHWDQYARGTIMGITRGTTDAHIARAVLEAIALQSSDVIGTMAKDSGIDPAELRVDGGAAVNNLLMQIQADVSGLKVIRPKVTETTALGAAYLAGLATGFWDNVEQIQQQWAIEQTFEPKADRAILEHTVKHWKRAVERSKKWLDD